MCTVTLDNERADFYQPFFLLKTEGVIMSQTNHGSQIKNDSQYEKLKQKGMSKEKAARIANSDKKEAGKKGGSHSAYEKWNVDQLRNRASELGLSGYSNMDKEELIKALRHH